MITQNIDISELLIVFRVNIFIKLAWLDIKRAASFFDDNKYDDEWTENGYKIKFKRTPIINIADVYISKK
ncbi:hypothetical protein KHU1_1510 [Bacillus amyloliquefaciens KHG19]|nr:hypothetical protein KHU1_1510 [Bacillus amyloliquefaciens KHG19]